MANPCYKNPPVFDPRSMSYETWKNELAVWQCVTELPKRKLGPVVALSLTGNAKDAALQLSAETLNTETGFDELVVKLDSVFLKEEKDRMYEAYQNFDSFRRCEMNMNDYITEFEKRYNRFSKFQDATLPDAVLAFKLLDNANLSQQEKQLALTACVELTFALMKSALKRVFGEAVGACADESIRVKEEPVYVCQGKKSFVYRDRQKKWDSRDSLQRGTNPINKFGKRTKCAICQSTFHWAKDCEHRSKGGDSVKIAETESENNEEQCNLTLFTRQHKEENEIFLTESYGCAVIDTACSHTVCGQRWLDDYLDSLDSIDKMKVEIKASSKPFRFGDGGQVRSNKNAVIPAIIGDTCCNIDTEVIDGDLPLLLSKTSLKRAATVLDLNEDKATMFNQPVQLQFTSSGHYCVDIRKPHSHSTSCDCQLQPKDETIDETEVLRVTEGMTEDEKRKTFTKLHKQFGHASADRLRRLLESAESDCCDTASMKILDGVIKTCETCSKYRREPARPAVGLPLATEFNETVSVDLHQLEKNLWYLHIIDEFTRHSAAALVRSKQPSEIAQKFLKSWVSVHGAPGRLFSDNGGEFNNREVQDMCENFNIEVKTTAGMAPWSNGLLERHNRTLTEIVLKVRKEQKCDWDTALSWAVMAKNCLCNIHGYSSHQLVYGRNPNLPTVLVNKPPAMEGTTMSKVVAEHIASLHSARRSFTQVESSERIRRALRKQTRSYAEVYKSGDRVYYKRPDNNEWKGPATVIGKDGAVIFARHGGMLIRVHQCRLRKVDCDLARQDQTDENRESATSDTQTERGIRGNTADSETDDDTEIQNTLPPACGNDHVAYRPRSDRITLKTGQNVKFQPTDAEKGTTVTAKVLGRAGKATGKYRNWYNLEYIEPGQRQGEGRQQSVDLESVSNLEIETHNSDNVSLEPEESTEELNDNESVACSTVDDTVLLLDVSWDEAKQTELENWEKNDVFEIVPDQGQKCISTRWICTLKDTTDGTARKARLVARGFEEIDNEQLQKDSPTCAKESLRIVLSIMAQRKWKPHTMDIKAAFLQGQPLDRDIHLRPPQEAKESIGCLWRLKKCVYGLNDASLNWYKRVKAIMLESGAEISKVDPAVFYWRNDNGELCGVLASHVDDFIWGGNNEFESTVIKHLRSKLLVSKEDSDSFLYIGMGLSTIDGDILLHQDAYADKMTHIQISKVRAQEKDSQLLTPERDMLRSKIGQLLWIAHQSRPDLLFDACQLAANLKHAQIKDILEMNKIIRRIPFEQVSLKFQNLGQNPLTLMVYSDASLGNLNDGGTQGGYFIALVGEDGKFSPLCWNSKKIRRVVRSTLAGETLAMADAIDTGIFLSTLYSELMFGKPDPIHLPLVCVTDCRSLFDAVKSTKCVSEKRLRLDVSGIKELLESGQVKQLKWSETNKQLADCLTKKGASALTLMKCFETGVLSV